MMNSTDSIVEATVRPCGFEAVARWGQQEIARSSRALRLDAGGQRPTIWFPWGDVRPDLLTSGGDEQWRGGEVERFDIVGPVPDDEGPFTWTARLSDETGGSGVVRRVITPPVGLGALAGYCTVDHMRARVELIDAVEGTDPRDVTTKRFPQLG